MPCSRTQHGLTRVGLKPPTSGSGIRGINHQATALPQISDKKCCNCPKSEQSSFIEGKKGANRMAHSADPDQTAPATAFESGPTLLRSISFCATVIPL